MSNLPPGYEDDGFSIELKTSGGSMTLRLSGEADRGAVPRLQDYVERLHAQLQRLRAREVLVDLRDLAFMNSSCFRVLIHWVVEITKLKPDARYRLILRHDPDVLWQRQSYLSLQGFAPDVVSLQSD